jgi:uncharacterized protein YaaR (DUF327 family)
MVKISVFGDFLGAFVSPELVEKKRENRILQRDRFSTLLADSVEELGQQAGEVSLDDAHLEQALDNVFVLGDKLKKDITLSYLAEYKKAVKNFIEVIIKRAYGADRVKGRIDRQTMIQKEYNLIRVIDDNLDRLARAVLGEQRDVLFILERIDEIRGLIIDYMW